jgi:GT2 family glycosyltransferase
MNLSIIIPNYNGSELMKKNLPRLLESIQNYKEGNIEIIIADDPSTDNSEAVIRDFIHSIKQKNISAKTIENKNKNESGFSKNVNRAVKIANGDILVLLNTDIKPDKDFLKSLIPHFADQNVFAVGCMDESIEGNRKVLRGRGIGKWEKGFLLHTKGNIDKTNTLWASGGSSAFYKKIWDEIGGLDEIYNPFYWEDIDISYRALKSGYKILFEKNSKVIHEHEKGAIRTMFKTAKITNTAYRNQFIFVWLNITDRQLLLSHIMWLPYHFLTAFKRKDWSFFTGFLHALGKIDQVLDKRKNHTRHFTKTDKEILSDFQT